MKSIKSLYRIGAGPSSSHTIGPQRAAKRVLQRFPDSASFHVTLYGSLAATGKGHMTDQAIIRVLGENTEFSWHPEQQLPEHPNGLEITAYSAGGKKLGTWRGYSIGGGAVQEEGSPVDEKNIYPFKDFTTLCAAAKEKSLTLPSFVDEFEKEGIDEHLANVWNVMQSAIKRGLKSEGVLPGGLKLQRKAKSFFAKTKRNSDVFQRTGLLSSYALAVSEENAAGGEVVTAPTCGAAGVLPAVLKYLQSFFSLEDEDIISALKVAGIIGNVVRQNASISGALVGCQGEVGTACAMAAGAACHLMGGSTDQIEYAAEMGMEHHLGLTCDPVQGLVQIPCIERNAVAATRAVDCADYSLLSDGYHRVSFDDVVEVMKETGVNLNSNYKETSLGGLARLSFENRRF
ncbi:MAG: L-serine ammonia-lyase [Spirochaetia bacterium]